MYFYKWMLYIYFLFKNHIVPWGMCCINMFDDFLTSIFFNVNGPENIELMHNHVLAQPYFCLNDELIYVVDMNLNLSLNDTYQMLKYLCLDPNMFWYQPFMRFSLKKRMWKHKLMDHKGDFSAFYDCHWESHWPHE